MANVGYTLMTEQAGPKDLVRWAARAEDTGFDLLVTAPWPAESACQPVPVAVFTVWLRSMNSM